MLLLLMLTLRLPRYHFRAAFFAPLYADAGAIACRSLLRHVIFRQCRGERTSVIMMFSLLRQDAAAFAYSPRRLMPAVDTDTTRLPNMLAPLMMLITLRRIRQRLLIRRSPRRRFTPLRCATIMSLADS